MGTANSNRWQQQVVNEKKYECTRICIYQRTYTQTHEYKHKHTVRSISLPANASQVNCDDVLGTILHAAAGNISRNEVHCEYFEYLPYQ